MQHTVILAAFIRFFSIGYFVATLLVMTYLPPYLIMFSHKDKFPSSGQTAYVSLFCNGAQIGIHLLAAILFWIFAQNISNFIFSSLEKQKSA
jgi:hypothetical protein